MIKVSTPLARLSEQIWIHLLRSFERGLHVDRSLPRVYRMSLQQSNARFLFLFVAPFTSDAVLHFLLAIVFLFSKLCLLLANVSVVVSQ